MQVISENYLPDEKEIWKKDFRRQQEERGQKGIVSVGDRAGCPECGRTGHIVWVSKDGTTVGIQCPASHNLQNHPHQRIGKMETPRHKTIRNSVFLTEIK